MIENPINLPSPRRHPPPLTDARCDPTRRKPPHHQQYLSYNWSQMKYPYCSPVIVILIYILNPVDLIQETSAFNHSERLQLRFEAKQMFYHAYHSYINTYPADEILPISCRGRFRQVEDLSDIDDSIGNFSLTLVDSLDTLVMMGDIDEFNVAIKRIIQDLNFDMDIVVSVFETNIRMLGGLLSAHVLAKSIKDPKDRNIKRINETVRSQLDWYQTELLDLANDLGRRLLPAFETKTGIPHPRVNLRHGMKSSHLRAVQETCTACAGSLILEFATLSRLTGNSIYEEKARKALDSLWQNRHQSTDLVGTVINVETGVWVRRESGVGAGSDSYYEYLMKAYILLGDQTYLHRFNRHYSSVMRYISRGPFLIDVHMHRPNRVAKGFMDALSAFWPGLQVLKGDLRSAISTHAMFSEVIRRHSYLPEAFTTDLQVYWAHHQMRPEFLESTFFLHRATREDYYLDTGKEILRRLQDLRVDCGFAGLKDVRTGVHDDRMPSFVLAETLKYLHLLFSEDNELHVDLDKFIFSTEGHLLPIDLALLNPPPSQNTDDEFDNEKIGRQAWYALRYSEDKGDLRPDRMAEIADWFNQMPPVTRYWFAGSLGLPILCRFNLFSPYSMILTGDFLKNLEIWKPLTAVLYYPLHGNKGFHFLMNLFLIYNYSQRLEMGNFTGRQADYLFMLLFNWLTLVCFGWSMGIGILMDPMVMSVIYVYCMINQEQIVSFWFGTRFKARYLPWALFGVNLITGGGGISDLIGILVGHLYYFVMLKYPADQGVTLLQTPQFLYDYFPSTRPTPFASTDRPRRPDVPHASAQTTGTTSHNWGRGNRLED